MAHRSADGAAIAAMPRAFPPDPGLAPEKTFVMTPNPIRQPADLIADILVRFHEAHRRDLPAILALARTVEARGGAAALSDRLAAMGAALESHMFKEEMRLFPMMEQGGNSLIGHLIADMEAEHLQHLGEMRGVESLLASLSAVPGGEPELAALRAAVDKLFGDIAAHIAVEDEQLFPLFIPAGSP
jgi:regulator of cell morphogenesis and NO signaling